MKTAKVVVIVAVFSALLYAQDPARIGFEPKTPGLTFETAPAPAVVSQKTATELIAQGCIELGRLTLTTPDLKQDLTPAVLKEAEGHEGDIVILYDSVNESETAYKQKCAEKRVVDGPPAWDNHGQFRNTRILQCVRFEDDHSKPYTVYVRRISAQVFRCSYDRARYAELYARLLKDKAAADSSLQAINDRIRREPESGEAFRQRAQFYVSNHDYQLAISDYSKAIELNASDLPALKGRGEAYSRIGNTDSARYDYEKAVDLDPNDVETLERAAASGVRGTREASNLSERISYLKEIREDTDILNRNPTNVQALLDRALAYANIYDYKRAIQDYDEALRLDPTNNKILEKRVFVYSVTKDIGAKIADLTELIRREPDNVIWVWTRAEGYQELGDYDRAIQEYTEWLRRDPNSDWTFFQRAQAYKKIGQKKLADQDMKEYNRLQKRK